MLLSKWSTNVVCSARVSCELRIEYSSKWESVRTLSAKSVAGVFVEGPPILRPGLVRTVSSSSRTIEVDRANCDDGVKLPSRVASVDSHPGRDGAELVGWRRKNVGNLGRSCIEAELGSPFRLFKSSVLARPNNCRVGLLLVEEDWLKVELGDALPGNPLSLVVLDLSDLSLPTKPTTPLALSIK